MTPPRPQARGAARLPFDPDTYRLCHGQPTSDPGEVDRPVAALLDAPLRLRRPAGRMASPRRTSEQRSFVRDPLVKTWVLQ